MNMPIAMDKKLAIMMMTAMDLREKSFDKVAADAATEKADKAREAEPDNLMAGHVDYSTFYRVSMEEAANQAAVQGEEPNMGPIIYYLMYHAWNDIQVWIKEHALA